MAFIDILLSIYGRQQHPLYLTFIKYSACNKSVSYWSTTLTYEYISAVSIQHGLQQHFVSVPEPKSGFPQATVLVVTFSGVYPQMKPPTKQASRFRSTARTSRPSLTNWDLVWPLVFKLLCHVSSNWYLMFSLLSSNLNLFCAASFCVCLQILASQCPLTLCHRAWSKILSLIYPVWEMCS